MTVDEFVNSLAELHRLSGAPATEPPPHGLCVLRQNPGPRRGENALEDLLIRFDCTRLLLGRVTFVSLPRPHYAGQVVGVFESEPIVLERTGELSLYEHERFGEKLLDCARDAASFFAALTGFLRIAYQRRHWLTRLDAAAQHCAELAGGPRYEPFYTALCGYLDYGT